MSTVSGLASGDATMTSAIAVKACKLTTTLTTIAINLYGEVFKFVELITPY